MKTWLVILAAVAACAQTTLPLRVGSTGSESVRDVAVDQRGNLVTACTFERTVDFDPAAAERPLTANGGIDACVVKFDAAGNYQWAITYGGPGDEEIVSVATDLQGNIYVAGTFTGGVDFDPGPGVVQRTSRGGRDVYFLKLTPEGRLLWEFDFGSTLDDQVYHLKLDSAGGIYLTGFYQRTVNFGTGGGVANFTSAGGNDLYLARYDTNGNYVNAISIGANDDERGYALGIDSTGVIWLFGSFVSRVVDFDPGSAERVVVSQGGSDFFLSRFTPELNHLSTFGFGGVQDDTPAPGGLFIDFQNHVALTGSFRGTADLNPGPGVFNRTSLGEADGFLLRLNSRGEFQQALSFGGTANDSGLRVMVDLNGAAYVTGFYTAQANFDQGPGTRLLTANGRSGATDGFIVRYNPNNSIGWLQSFGGTPSAGLENNGAGTGLVPDGRGFLLLGGRYYGRMTFGPAPGVEMPNEGASDIFLARFDSEGRLVRDLTQVKQIAAVTANANFQITPLTGGSVHTLFGNAMTTATEAFTAVPLTTRLCGVEVRITDAAGREWLAPMYFCSPNQINFIAPRGMAEGRAILNLVSATDRVTTTVEIAKLSPAIFVIDAQGTGAIVFGAGPFPGRVVSEAAPSRPGDLILVYLGGLGPVTPEIADGVLVQALHTTLTPARVRIQNQEAQVLFSGLAPGNPGLYQLNVIVPSGLAPGTYPLTVTIENRTSPSVPLVVR